MRIKTRKVIRKKEGFRGCKKRQSSNIKSVISTRLSLLEKIERKKTLTEIKGKYRPPVKTTYILNPNRQENKTINFYTVKEDGKYLSLVFT